MTCLPVLVLAGCLLPVPETDAGAPSSSSSSSGGDAGRPDAATPRDAGQPDAATGAGTLVRGQVLSPSGAFGLFDALVTATWTDADGGRAHRATHALPDGTYSFRELPPGNYTLDGRRGRHHGTRELTLDRPDQQLLQQDIRVDGDARFLVVSGDYDSIEDVVGPAGLGFPLTVLDGGQSSWFQAVTEPGYLDGWDVLFLDCGLEEGGLEALPDLEGRRQRLRTWVEAGHSLYASDWAYDLVEGLYPASLDFFGDDAVANAAQQGLEETVRAQVVDELLVKIVGRGVDITYDLGGWALLQEAPVAPGVEPLLRGTVHTWERELQDVPLAVRLRPGTGQVVFTTFHNHAQLDLTMLRILQYMVMSL